MFKNFCAIFVFTLLINAVTFASPIVDEANLLSASEVQALNQKISSIEQKHGIRIDIDFLRTIGNREISTAARTLLEQNLRDGRNGNILLLVVMDERNWYISTDSKMDVRIPSVSGIGKIFVSSLSGGDYFGACNKFLDAVDSSMNYYEQNGAAYDGGFNPVAAMAAVVFGLIFGGMVRSWLISGMSNVRPEKAAMDYLKRETVKLLTNRDIYIFTNVVRRPKASGNGAMARGSSGGGGRGGSSGGGGGGGSF